MSTWRIGLISDTHGLLRSQARQVLAGCDLIFHAGDLGSPHIISELEQIAPTTAVRGNVDVERWAQSLKLTERVKLGEWSILIVHNIDDVHLLTAETNVVIFGHSHKFLEETKDSTLFVNPGSAGPRRFTLPITMAVLTLGEKATVERVVLSNQA